LNIPGQTKTRLERATRHPEKKGSPGDGILSDLSLLLVSGTGKCACGTQISDS
jgi:hypothetical protein